VEGAITPFDDCSAGSKPAYDGQPNVEVIGPSTNHEFCPTLRGNIFSKVPEGLNYIPEIVINSVDMYSMKSAMKAAIEAVKDIKGIRGISAGNYGGKLGRYKIYLRELF